MYSQAKSELELLREELSKTKSQLAEIKEKRFSLDWLPCKTLNQKMMIDKLRDNWDMLQLEDIEAICKI